MRSLDKCLGPQRRQPSSAPQHCHCAILNPKLQNSKHVRRQEPSEHNENIDHRIIFSGSPKNVITIRACVSRCIFFAGKYVKRLYQAMRKSQSGPVAQTSSTLHDLSGTETLRFVKRQRLRFWFAFVSCRRRDLKHCDLGALNERGQCVLGDCVPKRSITSCDLRCRAAI